MPKKKKAGKNTKSSGVSIEKRKLIEADIDGEKVINMPLASKFHSPTLIRRVYQRQLPRQLVLPWLVLVFALALRHCRGPTSMTVYTNEII